MYWKAKCQTTEEYRVKTDRVATALAVYQSTRQPLERNFSWPSTAGYLPLIMLPEDNCYHLGIQCIFFTWQTVYYINILVKELGFLSKIIVMVFMGNIFLDFYHTGFGSYLKARQMFIHTSEFRIFFQVCWNCKLIADILPHNSIICKTTSMYILLSYSNFELNSDT